MDLSQTKIQLLMFKYVLNAFNRALRDDLMST